MFAEYVFRRELFFLGVPSVIERSSKAHSEAQFELKGGIGTGFDFSPKGFIDLTNI